MTRQAIRPRVAPIPPPPPATFLQRVSITFNTHGDGKAASTLLHVFVRTRSSDTSFGAPARDFLNNIAQWREHVALGSSERNPYLAFGEALALRSGFGSGSSHTFDLPLRPGRIPLAEVVLPVVDVHILPSDDDRWAFSYTVTLAFSDGRSFSFSSDADGLTGIVLDQSNRNHCGIGTENPFRTGTPAAKPQTDAKLTRVVLEFATHDDDKHGNNALNVHIVNRLSATAHQDIAVGVDVRKGTTFAKGSVEPVVFGDGFLPLASPVALRDIVLPVVYLNVVPTGNDRWIFDYRVTYSFRDSRGSTFTFSSRHEGVILDQDQHKHAAAHQGDAFPSVTPPPTARLTGPAVGARQKTIPLALVRRKLDEFINHRQGVGGQAPPVRKLLLHNSGAYNWPAVGTPGQPGWVPPTLPETYYDLRPIEADPPAPGTLTGPGFRQGVKWTSSPSSLGQLKAAWGFADLYFHDVESKTITATLDATQPTPLVVEIDFDTSDGGTIGATFGNMDFDHLRIRVALTLTFDAAGGRVDVLSWWPELDQLRKSATPVDAQRKRVSGHFLGQPIDVTMSNFLVEDFFKELTGRVVHVDLATSSAFDAGGALQKQMRERIFAMFGSVPDRFAPQTTLRDQINAKVNSWLLGGVLGGANGSRVTGVHFDGDNFVISYTGPQRTWAPAKPAAWPPAAFTPGTLANIDHIVVLTMENRSFDHMLGYLSLPPAKGGRGRTDVDGLKGNETNSADGIACPSFPLSAGDTNFAPDPPHGYEPVFKAINGGKMDGFAQSYADERGAAVAPRIMGYHTAANVPVYDALARDFAIGHRWFASHPGPTFCNRFYELTGRLNIDPGGVWEYDNSSTLRPVFTPTIFDALSARGVSWRYFEHGYCFLRFFEQHTFDAANITAFDDPGLGFENLAFSGALPSVSFIDPHYIELPPDANCDGPPADIAQGQTLVQRVVETLVASPAWAKTMLIVTYDEHGGFYDHVPPPPAAKVAPESLPTYGVRVPAFVISPWVRGGAVFGHDGSGGVFDHTSILKTIARRFMPTNPPYLGARYAAANDLSSVLGNQPQPGPFRPFIAYNLVYGASKLRLDVPGASRAPGVVLQQFTPNTTSAQQFSFEDAGGGRFYIRTHTGGLYLTADPSGAVKQDVRYPAGAPNASSQHWQLTSTGISILDRDRFAIANAAFPGKYLEPVGNSTLSGIPVVLGPGSSGLHNANSWNVTSPLLAGGGGNHT